MYYFVTQNLPIGYFCVSDQNMRFYAKYAKFSFFAQIGPALFLASQSHLEPPHWLFLCFRSKYAILCKLCKIFIFRPNWPSTVLSITESPRTSPLVILVFQIKICDFMQNMQNFHFLPKLAQHCFKHHRVTQNLPIGYFGVPDENMRFVIEREKILVIFPCLLNNFLSVFTGGFNFYQFIDHVILPLLSQFYCLLNLLICTWWQLNL